MNRFLSLALPIVIINEILGFNDVIIVCRNKGYRGNRSIKMVEGGFASVSTPNLEALVSVNIKISKLLSNQNSGNIFICQSQLKILEYGQI
jgi:hypothetical protein